MASKQKKWKWTDAMVNDLLTFIKEFKSKKEFDGVDFEGDLIVFYREIRKMMAINFNDSDFGPVTVSECPKPLQDMNDKELKEFNDTVKLEKSAIKKGYDRVKEKIKALRQDYRTAVNNGTRSGSGRIVRDNWDDLTEIWAGSPATESIKNACTTREINAESLSELFVNDEEEEDLSRLSSSVHTAKRNTSSDFQQVDQPDQDEQENSESENSDNELASKKRLLPANPTPTFVDNKRKKLEKQLSAKQRDMVLINAAKKEIDLKTNIAHGLVESNKSINSAMTKMADSINSLGAGLVQGFGMLAQALSQNQQPQNHPVFGNLGMNFQPPFQPLSNFPGNQYQAYDGQPGNDQRMTAQLSNYGPGSG